MVLAALLPLGVLFVIVWFDGRVRSAEQVERLAHVPLLVSIPYAPSGEEHRRIGTRRLLSLLLLAFVFAAYLVAFMVTRNKVPQ
jgi:hypothetical protein